MDPDNICLRVYDVTSPNGRKHYYYDYDATMCTEPNDNGNTNTIHAVICDGSQFDTIEECLKDLQKKYPFVKI